MRAIICISPAWRAPTAGSYSGLQQRAPTASIKHFRPHVREQQNVPN